MAPTRAKWPKRYADERRFRFRVRITRPPGDGIWDQGPIRRWLNERLGRDGWGLYPDTWDGHGRDTYALHLDDHSAIGDLLALWEGQQLKLYAKPLFQACLGSNVIAAIRSALYDLQGRIVDDLNARRPTVSWTMGTCDFLPDAYQGNFDVLRVRRIKLLGEIDSTLSTVPPAGEPLTVVLEDEQRGAVELGLAALQDLRPAPIETIECLRLLLDALEEVKA